MYLYKRTGLDEVPTTLPRNLTLGSSYGLGSVPTAVDGFGQPRSQVKTITFPPQVITISPARKAEILRRGGWKQANIIVTARDYLGEPLRGHKLLAEFKAPGVADVVQGGDISGGAISWVNVWLKPEGTVRFFAVRLGRPSIAPEGVTHYRVPDRGPLRFQLTQRSTEVTVTATSSEEAAVKVGATGSAGIDYKIFKVGGEVSKERGRTTTTGLEYSWKIILPTAVFDVTQGP
jgi:hypothetical protein